MKFGLTIVKEKNPNSTIVFPVLTMDLTNLNKDRKTKRKAPLDLTTMVYGKGAPQAK